ncbi:hypothetical protein BH09ACT6_BH09ACT6_03830 [soil metagenome]
MADLGPLPGDPDVVLRDATSYERAAEAIAQAADQLRQLGSDRFHSQAVNALVSSASDAANTITQAHTRYSEAAQALLAYAVPMREAHDRANALTAANRDLGDRANSLKPQLDDYQRLAQTPGPDQPGAIAHLAQLQNEYDQLQSAMSQAEHDWNAAFDEMHQAASVAAGRIHRGNEFGDLNDSFWDDLGDIFDVVKLVADIVSIILKIVSIVLTVLAVVFAILAPIMPLFAIISALLFTYAQVVNLAIAILALLQFALNGFHLLDLVLVAFAVVAAYGGGALGDALGAAAKSAAAGATEVLGDAASAAAGELAKQAVSEAMESVTRDVVDGILSLGSPDAQGLYAAVSPIGSDALGSAFGDSVTGFTDTFDQIGQQVGSDFSDAIAATGIPGAAGSAVGAVVDAARPAAAALGQAYDAVYGVGSQVADAVTQIGDSIQTAADQGSRAALGSVFGQGMDGFSSQLSRDLGGGLAGPDIQSRISDAVTSQLGGIVGGIPGGDAVLKATADGFGDLAQSVYSAANDPRLGAAVHGG